MTDITNFGTLKTAVGEISHRGELLAEAVARAEAMIARHVRATEMQTTASLGEGNRASLGSAVYNLPAGLIDVVSMSGSVTEGLFTRRTVDELTRYFDTNAPVHSFALRAEGGTMRAQFRGLPALNATMALQYWQRLPKLVADSDTNGLLLSSPDLYLHAALHWQHLVAQDLELAQMHRDLFFEEAETVNALAARSHGAGATAGLVLFEHGGPM